MYIYIYIYINTHIHIYIYTHIHTYIYTQAITGVERHPLLCKASREIIKNNNFTNINIIEVESFFLNVGNKGYMNRANVIVSETLDAWIIEVYTFICISWLIEKHKCI
jgi:predicted RNA methylase